MLSIFHENAKSCADFKRRSTCRKHFPIELKIDFPSIHLLFRQFINLMLNENDKLQISSHMHEKK